MCPRAQAICGAQGRGSRAPIAAGRSRPPLSSALNYTSWRLTIRAGGHAPLERSDIVTGMAKNGSIFGAMLQEFDGAARILNLEPGIWKILTHPKRQITVSCPVQMDNGEIEVFTGYRVQYNITLGPAK